VKEAFHKAERFQALFYQSLLNRGKLALDQVGPDEKVMVIVGRPYNSCDPGVNLEIPKKLRDLGVLAIPMDFLPLESVAPSVRFGRCIGAMARGSWPLERSSKRIQDSMGFILLTLVVVQIPSSTISSGIC